MIDVEVENGKYRIITDDDGSSLRALRHGEEWRDLLGDNMVFSLAYELQEARVEIERLKERLKLRSVKVSELRDFILQKREEIDV